MSNVRIITTDQEILDRVKEKILSRALSEGLKINEAPNFNGALFLELMGGMESLREKLEAIPNPSEMQAILKAAIRTVNTKVDSYAAKKGYSLYALEADGDKENDEESDIDEVVEDAEFEIQKGDDPDVDTSSFNSSISATDSLGEAIQSMFQDLAKKHADEIINLSNTVLKLEKINQESMLKEKKAEDGEFIEDTDDEEETSDNKDEASKENETNEDETDNPFGEPEDDTTDDSTDDTENPFSKEGDDTDNEDSKDTEEDSNPFDGGDNDAGESGKGNESDSGDTDNPFDDGSDNESEGSFESLASANSYDQIRVGIMGGEKGFKYNPFFKIESGDVLNFAKKRTKEFMKDTLEQAYATESENPKALEDSLKRYKEITRSLFKSTVDTMAVSAVLGLSIDQDRIKYPDIY